MGIKNSKNCDYCSEPDYIEHFFWHCTKVKPLWKECIDYVFEKSGENVVLSEEIVLFGYKPEQSRKRNVQFINHVLLIAKMVISKFRYGTPLDVSILFRSEIQLRQHLLK